VICVDMTIISPLSANHLEYCAKPNPLLMSPFIFNELGYRRHSLSNKGSFIFCNLLRRISSKLFVGRYMSPSKYESSKEINTMITILNVFALNVSRTEIRYCRDNYLHSTENHFLGVG